MDATLKRDFKITFEDFKTNDGLQTMILKAGDRIPISIIDKWFIREYPTYESLLDKFYIDFDKLKPTDTSTTAYIEDLIIERDDFEVDLAAVTNKMCLNAGISQEELDRIHNMTQQERLDELNKIIEGWKLRDLQQ